MTGARLWAHCGAPIPARGTGAEPEFTSRDTLALLNLGPASVPLTLALYYADREPVAPYKLDLPAERVRKIRINDLIEPEAPLLEEPYGVAMEADGEIIVQVTRQDTRQVQNAGLHATAYFQSLETAAELTMDQAIGRRLWAIAEGYIPATSNGPSPEMTSHETACILNAGDGDARVEITLYFTDREPVGPYRVTAPARRTVHVRFNDLVDPAPVPRGVEYASVIRSDAPIVVQHSRLDSRQAENALMTTIAFSQ
jgi:hypothetical protein